MAKRTCNKPPGEQVVIGTDVPLDDDWSIVDLIHYGLTVAVRTVVDEDAENPLKEWDGVGSIYGNDARFIEYLDKDSIPDEYQEYMVPLGKVADGEYWPESGPLGTYGSAGVWYPDVHIVQSLPVNKGRGAVSRQLRKIARSTCELYADWAHGDVFGFELLLFATSVFQHRTAFYDHVPFGCELTADSCFGFYGANSSANGLVEHVQDSLDAALKEAADLLKNNIKCDNCGARYASDDVRITLETVSGLEQRLTPGSVVPAGECPDCGALCYLLEGTYISG